MENKKPFFEELIDFLDRLEAKKIYYRLDKVRDGIMVNIAVPGERWEVEFLKAGTIEVERFKTEAIIHDESELDVLFREFSD